jgi:fibronectin type 3 domain-containing protein
LVWPLRSLHPSGTAWSKGYNIHRATSKDGTFTGPINATIVEDTWYVDDDPTLDPGGTYCYYVTTVGADARESAPSNEVCIDRFLVSVRPDSAGAVFQSGDLVVVVADTGITTGVTYGWVQLAGPVVLPVDLARPELVFPAPEVAEAATLEFRVDAQYG